MEKIFPTFSQQLRALENDELTEEQQIPIYQVLVDTEIIDTMDRKYKQRAQRLIDSGKVRWDPQV